jgi:hypothetical protein
VHLSHGESRGVRAWLGEPFAGFARRAVDAVLEEHLDLDGDVVVRRAMLGAAWEVVDEFSVDLRGVAGQGAKEERFVSIIRLPLPRGTVLLVSEEQGARVCAADCS